MCAYPSIALSIPFISQDYLVLKDKASGRIARIEERLARLRERAKIKYADK